ncbi:MAG: alcohol dehydrogenase [Alphaproteobacteria bacterium]|nr:alcohol dehydrogenase [Alphaproteobacteria bacterium]
MDRSADRQMRVIRARHPVSLDALAMETAEIPQPGPGEIQLRLRASSLNYHDYVVAGGRLPVPDGMILLSDGAGEVTALGEGVAAVAPGDHLFSRFFPHWDAGPPRRDIREDAPGDKADGFACEWTVKSVSAFTPAPRGYSAAEAATLTCAGVTAWRALMVDGPLAAGETVLIMGSGGVSIFALQFAKAAGATVIATSSSDAKLERLGALGADHLINYRKTERWGDAAKRLTNGVGVDHVIEIGGAGTLDQSMSATRVGGHIALVGILAGLAAPVTTALLMTKQLRVQGLAVGSGADQVGMTRFIETHGIRPVIDSHFPLERLADAFRHQESGAHFGKICIDI